MDELKNIAPELSKIEKENPFQVPDNYFDDFTARLHVKLESEKTEEPEVLSRFVRYIKPALAMAAGFALIFMLVYWPIKLIMPENIANNTTFYENGNIDIVYRNMVEGIDEYSFIALLDETPNEVSFSDDEIVSYLQTNSSDYDILNEN